jgi:hypothetical protein
MPRLDAYIPEGALSDEAENQLLSKLTDILLRNEGADPADPAARSIAFVWLHRPAKMFVAVEPAEEPRYRFEPRVPQGQFDDERRQSMVAEITEGFSTPKTGLTSAIHSGFGCFPTRSPRGRGEPPAAFFRLADITGFVFGDEEKGREYAETRLAARRDAEVAT